MVKDSSNLINAQNLTIENALRQAREWQDSIADTADNFRRKIGSENSKLRNADADIGKVEEQI